MFGLIKHLLDSNGSPYLKHRDIHSHLYDLGFFDGTVDPALPEEAATIGEEGMRAHVSWPGKSNWQGANKVVDELFTVTRCGFYASCQHQVCSFQATFNTIEMTRPPKNTGSQVQHVGSTVPQGRRFTKRGFVAVGTRRSSPPVP